jgi:hypothetical protein
MASISTIRVFSARTIAASGSLTSQAFKLGSFSDVQGYFSLHVELSGDGTGLFQYAVSNNNSNFIISDDASDNIVTAHTKASGPDSNGIHIYQFSPITAQWVKVKVTETGGASNITVSAWLAIQ